MLSDLPVFAICGHSGSGKTTLIETLLPRLRADGLAVAVAKFHAHGIDVDRPGKDSDRFFRAGADVFLQGPDQGFSRIHPPGGAPALQLAALARRYDLVLVEGRKPLPCAKVWLLREGERRPPRALGPALACLSRDADRAEAAWGFLESWLPVQWRRPPVFGCVLIGGRSMRMGRPKHLLRQGRGTWLEHTVGCLRPVVEKVVIAGAGEVPRALADVAHLPDAPGVSGPLAGILAAMRWAPWATWLVAACDLPNLSPQAIAWLLETRTAGIWATLPRPAGGRGVEPLLAHYDFRARAILEGLAAEGDFSPSRAADHPKVLTPRPPAALRAAWENVNTPADLVRRPSRGSAK
ncbi:MAG: molybdopterin-guanine dinucleotide biosynthesis protein B [Planctomycetota bacterium]|nr:molybdopterin-guanine dinucleotide biosynthesis protein B [Planctomycetota bacterium]